MKRKWVDGLMIRAIVQNGQIHPLEPLPAEWIEGREVIVEDAESTTVEELEAWYRELQSLGPAGTNLANGSHAGGFERG